MDRERCPGPEARLLLLDQVVSQLGRAAQRVAQVQWLAELLDRSAGPVVRALSPAARVALRVLQVLRVGLSAALAEPRAVWPVVQRAQWAARPVRSPAWVARHRVRRGRVECPNSSRGKWPGATRSSAV